MSSSKVIYGLYDDDDKLVHATKTLVGKGKIQEGKLYIE